jgi:hypothetical protein
MHGFEVEARSGDIPVDYNSPVYARLKYLDRPIRGSVAIRTVRPGARRVYMDTMT